MTTGRCTVPSCGKSQSSHRLPSDPNIWKKWINFIFNEVPLSIHFIVDSFTNKAQFDAGFSERLQQKTMLFQLYWINTQV